MLSLTARYGKDLPVINSGLVWRVFADRPDETGTFKLIREERGATPNIVLPPGSYVVHVALGLVSAVRAVTPEIGDRSRILRASGRRPAHRRPRRHQQDSAEPDFVRDLQGQPVRRSASAPSLVPNVAAGDVALLPEGTYYIISNYGDANSVVRSDIRVQAGKLTDVTITHRAAVITLKLVSDKGGEALANTAWSVITPGGDVIKESIGAFPARRAVRRRIPRHRQERRQGVRAALQRRQRRRRRGRGRRALIACSHDPIVAEMIREAIQKPRHDIRQRRARAVFARLRRRADMDEAGELFVRLQSQPVEHVAVEREPAGQPARAIAERGRGGDDVHRAGAGGQFLLPGRHLGMRFGKADHADHQRRVRQPALLDLDLGRLAPADFSARTPSR